MAAVSTHSVSEARRIERVAAAMFNTPDPGDDEVFSTWPPTHPEDLAWWLNLAEAAISTLKADTPTNAPTTDPKPWVAPNGYRYADFNEGESMFGGIAYRPRPEYDNKES